MATHPGMTLLVEAVGELGFRKRAGRVFTTSAGDCCGWLGLNTASRAGGSGQLLINPVVGVRWPDVEEWVARGRVEKVHPYLPPTCSEPLRYLLPGERRVEWILGGGSSDRDVVSDIVSALRTFGVAFIDKMGDLDVLSGALGAMAFRDQQSAYRWPVALLLSGQPDASLEAVAGVRRSLGAREDQAAEDLRMFLDWFQREVTAGD